MKDDSDSESPIQGLLDALKMGRSPLSRISRLAGKSAGAYRTGVLEAMLSLDSTLCQIESKITEVYVQSEREFGRPFINELSTDYIRANRIQTLTIHLMTQLMGLQKYLDEPSTLKLSRIMSLEEESERCCEVALIFLGRTRQKFIETNLHNQKLLEQPNEISKANTEPALIRAHCATATSDPKVSAVNNLLTASSGSRFFDNMAQLDSEAALAADHNRIYVAASQPTNSLSKENRFSRDSAISEALSERKSDSSSASSFISRDDVVRRLIANEDFLSRRQRSRSDFEEQLRTEIFLGVHDLPTDMITTKHSQEGSREISQQSCFPPWTPSANGYDSDFSILSATLRLPGYGINVADGIEPVAEEVSSTPSNGLILVNDGSQSAPLTSLQSGDCAMSHEDSFYMYGGFCEGAKMRLRGEKDFFKIVKRPVGTKFSFVTEMAPEDVLLVNRAGQYYASIVARCAKCLYEVDWDTFKLDTVLDETGIHNTGNHGMRYRTSFLSKCHLGVKSAEDSIYACIFCVAGGKTLKNHGATVFFSVEQYMRHLTRHTRPVPHIEGIKVSYVIQSNYDFDLQFIRKEAKHHPSVAFNNGLSPILTARAIVEHRPKSGKPKFNDPDGQPALQFAIGARIIGIDFPTRFNGQWCSGYHDGEFAIFPYNTIQFDGPMEGEIVMDPKSPLVATARWDHKPKDTSSGWLTFSKKEKITNISFHFEDNWCCSGQTGKGKFGLFPATFVTNVGEDKNVRIEGGGSKLLFLKHGWNKKARSMTTDS